LAIIIHHNHFIVVTWASTPAGAGYRIVTTL